MRSISESTHSWRLGILEAARLKANHAMAYADAFAFATSIANGATLLTGDPELLDRGVDWPVEDLRAG
jgi:hypothetical protein